MNRCYWIAVCVALVSSTAAFADDLEMNLDAVPMAIAEASGRTGLPLKLEAAACDPDRIMCVWSLGLGVLFRATSKGDGRVYALAADWSNGTRDTEAGSAELFRKACTIMVAAVMPRWTSQDVQDVADHIALTSPAEQDASPERTINGFTFYGSRTAPGVRAFPAEALMQCGVRVSQ